MRLKVTLYSLISTAIFAYAAMAVDEAKPLVNAENFNESISKVIQEPENGDINLFDAIDLYALNADNKTKSKICAELLDKVVSSKTAANYYKRRAWELVINIAGENDVNLIKSFKSDKFSSEFVEAALEKIGKKQCGSKVEVLKQSALSKDQLKEMLNNFSSMTNPEKVYALAQFYFGNFAEAKDIAKAEIANPEREVALNAIRTYYKFATASDLSEIAKLLRDTSDVARKRAIFEGAMSVNTDGFDGLNAVKNCDIDDITLYGNIALAQDQEKAIDIILPRIKGESGKLSGPVEMIFQYINANNAQKILSAMGVNKSFDVAMYKASVKYLRGNKIMLSDVVNVFNNLPESAKLAVIKMMSIGSTPDMLAFTTKVAKSGDAKISKAALESIFEWRSIEPIFALRNAGKIGDMDTTDIIYTVVKKNMRSGINDTQRKALTEIFNKESDPKYSELLNSIGWLLKSEKEIAGKSLMENAKVECPESPDELENLLDSNDTTFWHQNPKVDRAKIKITLAKKSALKQLMVRRNGSSPDGYEVYIDGKLYKKVSKAICMWTGKFFLNLEGTGQVIEIVPLPDESGNVITINTIDIK